MKPALRGQIVFDKNFKIGVVTSRFNQPITERLESEALKRLADLGYKEEQIVRVSVPGAFEIPLAAKQLLESGCHGVCALGAVIRGQTTHYDYVCMAVERGCSQLQLEYGRPVGFGVLTTENKDQAIARSGGQKENKGADTVDVVLEMLSLKQMIL
ncbi:MAG: 6,7-dimethyl-8-ribityllumazine synthase [Bdellovibrionales bacterium]|nr:6,7-dimethyl-8-ribityllumazine synthase [Bdellovibrionales bacterium]